MHFCCPLGVLSTLALLEAVTAYTWADTKNMFVFGASYTTVGWNITAGLNSTIPYLTSSNGPNWIMALNQRYNISPIALWDVAYPGAVVDNSFVATTIPGAWDLVTQTQLWKQYFSPAPETVPWTSENSLFMFEFGLNDVSNSMVANTTAATRPILYRNILKQYMAQLDILYQAGARNFLISNVPTAHRTPMWATQSPSTILAVELSTLDFNTQLAASVKSFIATYNTTSMIKKNGPLGKFQIMDNYAMFDILLDNADLLGYYNITGYCAQYVDGTVTTNTQMPGCLPASNYFWLNTFHPLWTVHDSVAKAMQRILSS